MTDLERFVDLYQSFGIECVVNDFGSEGKTIELKDEVENKSSVSDDGYSIVHFGKNGNFVRQFFYSK